MTERSQLVNAIIGAAVTIVLVFIPFSSILGGGVAGYLHGGEPGDGLRVGALSGLLAAVPMLLLFGFMGLVVSAGMLGMGRHGVVAFGGMFLLAALFVALVYLVGLSALGGVVGATIHGEVGGSPTTDE